MNWKFWVRKSADHAEKKPKSKMREWWDAILFAVVAATLIRWLIMEAYTIPTPSMENSMMVGDFLFVSKFHYGTQTPRTPLQIPLTHQKIWFTNIPSYLNWIELPSYRLPGFTHVKQGDVVVFHVPRIEENNYEQPYNRSQWIDYPVDLKTNYIKRCVALPGDVLKIENRQLIVNNQPFQNPVGLRYQYLVESTSDINARNIEKFGLDGDDFSNQGRANKEKPTMVYYTMFLTEKQKEIVKAEPYIKSVEFYESPYEAARFPFSKYTSQWTGNNYGPLTIPKEGMTIAINDSTLSIYGTTIRDYDGNTNAEIKDGKLTIDGKEITEYTFKQDYYFMMGDNRDNSLDSRYWGFVPEDHIVGKGFFIWLSIDKYGTFLNKIRWNRFFKPVR
ncbi:MAG: signal peptidase I [Cytophagales bacterium]|nr:signal peptidase I [Cytophagales bacterium]